MLIWRHFMCGQTVRGVPKGFTAFKPTVARISLKPIQRNFRSKPRSSLLCTQRQLAHFGKFRGLSLFRGSSHLSIQLLLVKHFSRKSNIPVYCLRRPPVLETAGILRWMLLLVLVHGLRESNSALPDPSRRGGQDEIPVSGVRCHLKCAKNILNPALWCVQTGQRSPAGSWP